MKTMKTVLVVLFLAGAMGSSIASAAGVDGVISKDALTEGSYCHIKFPAIEERTLSWKRPVLKDPSEGDIIDFYGPCDHDPLGNEEVQSPEARPPAQVREGIRQLNILSGSGERFRPFPGRPTFLQEFFSLKQRVDE